MFEKEAEEYSNNWRINKKANLNFAELVELRAVIYKAYKDGATQETALLSQHILDLQKDKGNLTDRVRELEQQIEKMKCPWNCKKFSNCKLSICPCDKWEIKEK
jgi:hypothetical protein